MAILDSLVDANFRSEQVGRVVTLPGWRRDRGFLVKSPVEELKIRALLKMFYLAQLSILFLALLLAMEWARELTYALGKPFALPLRIGVTLGFYALLAGGPYWALWAIYKKAVPSFVSVDDAVPISGSRRGLRWMGVLLGILVVLLLLGIMLLTRRSR
jgi:hypothetical protein